MLARLLLPHVLLLRLLLLLMVLVLSSHHALWRRTLPLSLPVHRWRRPPAIFPSFGRSSPVPPRSRRFPATPASLPGHPASLLRGRPLRRSPLGAAPVTVRVVSPGVCGVLALLQPRRRPRRSPLLLLLLLLLLTVQRLRVVRFLRG